MKLKHNANRATLEGKRVSWSTTASCAAPPRPRSSRWCAPPGATEVHMRIASPPTTHTCFYGVDTPERSKLLAARHSVEEMARDHRRRQPGLPLDRRPLPRGRRGAARRGPAAILRRLLHRRLPDPARRHRGRARRRAAQLRCSRTPEHGRRRASLDGPRRPGHRRLARPGRRRGRRPAPREGAKLVLVARTAAALEELDDASAAQRRRGARWSRST